MITINDQGIRSGGSKERDRSIRQLNTLLEETPQVSSLRNVCAHKLVKMVTVVHLKGMYAVTIIPDSE